MYNWRKMTDEQREYVLSVRKTRKNPWHSPPHQYRHKNQYHLTAACFEHKHILGMNPDRMFGFEKSLLEVLNKNSEHLYAWAILPNHYHALVNTTDLPILLKEIGELHGRTSFQWNGEDNSRGRKVWFRCIETGIKSDNHFGSTVNYIHNNPVRHKYVTRWQDWYFSSANDFIEKFGMERTFEIWQKFPVTGYGEDWDAVDM